MLSGPSMLRTPVPTVHLQNFLIFLNGTRPHYTQTPYFLSPQPSAWHPLKYLPFGSALVDVAGCAQGWRL